MSHTDYSVYVTMNEDGFFYLGRGNTKRILAGHYTGSGVFYNEFRRLNPNGWMTEVLVSGLSIKEAKSVEANLLIDALLDDPLCLNLCLGLGGWKMSPTAYKRFEHHCPEYHEKLFRARAEEYAAAMECDLNALDEETQVKWLEYFKTLAF